MLKKLLKNPKEFEYHLILDVLSKKSHNSSLMKTIHLCISAEAAAVINENDLNDDLDKMFESFI